MLFCSNAVKVIIGRAFLFHLMLFSTRFQNFAVSKIKMNDYTISIIISIHDVIFTKSETNPIQLYD